jgi:hypothetical protein
MLFPQVPHVTSVKAGLELAKSGNLAIQTVSSTRESSSCLEFDSRGGMTNSGQCLMAVKHKVDLATPDYGKWEARWHMRGHDVCTLVKVVASRARLVYGWSENPLHWSPLQWSPSSWTPVAIGLEWSEGRLTPVLQWTPVSGKTKAWRLSDWSDTCQAYPT